MAVRSRISTRSSDGMVEMGQGSRVDWSVGSGTHSIEREEKDVMSSERDDFGGPYSE